MELAAGSKVCVLIESRRVEVNQKQKKRNDNSDVSKSGKCFAVCGFCILRKDFHKLLCYFQMAKAVPEHGMSISKLSCYKRQTPTTSLN